MIDWLVHRLREAPTLAPGDAILVLVLATAVLFFVVSGGLSLAAVRMRLRAESRLRARRTKEAGWRDALNATLYDGAPSASLWSRVDEASALDFLHFLASYAQRLDGDELRSIQVLAAPYLPQVEPYLARRSSARRARAVQLLGELGLASYAAHVVAALDDPSPTVAMVAASALAHAQTPEYASEILRRLDRLAHWRQDFLVTMVASMGEGAAPALRRMLNDGSAAPKARAIAADALARLSDAETADAAALLVDDSEDVELRAAALRLLASVGREAHLPAVRRALHADAPLPVRLAAIRALGSLGLAEDLARLERAARDDPSPWVAIAAARALKEGGGREALEALAGSNHPRSALGLQVISEARSW